MIELDVNNLTKYYGANKIFEKISFRLQTGERTGLIGQNGCGKTTLMKVLMGVEDSHGGTISVRKGTKLGYLDQIYKAGEMVTVIQMLQESFENVGNLKNELSKLEEKLKHITGDELDAEMKNYGRLLDKYELAGGYEVETEINKICQGLMIADSFRSKAFEGLSGGEKTRVLLAKLLLEQPDVLLLDEPTNHLDIESIEWLENFLAEYKGTILIISHDRSFLDRVVNKIIELEPTMANLYDGNYSDYVIEKERRFELAYKAYVNNQRKIENMERQIERYRIWGAMRDSEVMYKRAKEVEKRLDKVEVVDRPNHGNTKIRLNQGEIKRTGKIVLTIENLEKSFLDKKLFSDLSFTLFYQDRLCIMGGNGSGKTTLLKILLKELSSDCGQFSLGANVRIGYLPQNIVFDNEELTILDYFSLAHKTTQLEARSELAKMLFLRDDVFKKIKSLSGGEKSRLKLCSIIFEKVNLLILDEPTNHLDIDSREVLEKLLSSYNGTIIFVSHDRYFVKKVATKMMIFKDANVKLYEMDYDNYVEETKKEVQLISPLKKEKKQIKANVPRPEKKKNNAFKIAEIEKEIEMLEEKIDIVKKEMLQYNNDANKLVELCKVQEGLDKQLNERIDLWSNSMI